MKKDFETTTSNNFCYLDERFADIQMLRYKVGEFNKLSLKQKQLVYCLSKATLYGRDITFDQFGEYNLRIRRLLEYVYLNFKGNKDDESYKAFVIYLKRVCFSNGIYHHYGYHKIAPGFSPKWLENQLSECYCGKTINWKKEFQQLKDAIFDLTYKPYRVNKKSGVDVVVNSACNFYNGVSQEEVEVFYSKKKTQTSRQPSWGLNSTLVKDNGGIKEHVWQLNGKYGNAIRHIVGWLSKSLEFTENEQQATVILLLIEYYKTGDLEVFDKYSIEWLKEQMGTVDFINGFIEVYGDPLGIKGTWEGIVEIRDSEATRRTETISRNAQWFEDHSPVAPKFRKPMVKGVTAHVVQAMMLGGDEYPSTAIGINLPNADWIRAEYGSKSVTIGNLTEAYNKAAKGNGFRDEFVIDNETVELLNKWGDICDDLHTDLHECLGHGSGRLLDGVDPDALKNYGNTIEEARADLFGLYYIADQKLLELGLLNSEEAYRSNYYSYMMNGLLTQLVRIEPGNQIEEAHMRNRALIARWTLEHADGAVELVKRNDKTFVRVNDYAALRQCFAILLHEIQRIKSEGDYDAAKDLVEKYAVRVDAELHSEILERYNKLNLAPYKGFINPRLSLEKDKNGSVVDVCIDYSEGYLEQMLRYSKEYGTLVL